MPKRGVWSEIIRGEPDPKYIATSHVERNFGRIHKTLGVTLAMQAGLSDHVWSLGEIVGLFDADDARTAA